MIPQSDRAILQWRIWPVPVLLGLSMMAHAQTDSGSPWIVSKDGQTVMDTGNQLVWRRCVEGMRWVGRTCRGRPLLLDHVQASDHARQQAGKDRLPWRLPRSLELSRLVDRAQQNPTVNPKVFPATPPEWHWTLSVTVNNPGFNQYNYTNIAKGATPGSVSAVSLEHAWAVNFADGEASGTILRRSPLVVRLVRNATELPGKN